VLKITTTREANDSIKVELCGQFTREYVAELEQAIFTGKPPDQNVALDLANVTFVDRDAMGFLCSAKTRKVSIVNIPSYVIRWIEQERVCGSSQPDSEKTEQ
jgi:ABC-type transporter Mla MlaB component